jgi:outer membrane protein
VSAWWLLASLSHGQDGLSLDEALNRAVGESETVELALAAVERARGDRWRARAAWLPTLAFTAGYTHTFKTEFDRLFEDVPGGGGSLPFGQDDTWRATFSLNQPIFGGGRAAAGSRIASASTLAADAGVSSAHAAAALSAAQAYFDAALADRLLQIAQETAAQATQTLEETRLANEVGRKPPFELLRAQVEADNAAVAVLRAQRNAQLAHLRLAQLLDVSAEETATLATPVEEEEPRSLVPQAAAAAGVEGAPPEERLPVLQARQAALISEKYVAVTRGGFFPSLAFSASYGWTQYPDGAIPTFEDRAWYPGVSAGLNLSVPLFNGGRVHGEVMNARATAMEAQIRADQAAEIAELEAKDAEAELISVEAGWEATRGTVEQAEQAYAIAELRFQEGVSTQTELADTRLLLQQALANRAQAARDLQVARIKSALLPYLPLATR